MKLLDNNTKKEITFITKEAYEEAYRNGFLEENKYCYVQKVNPRKAQNDCDFRIPQLKAMHSFCCNANDENIAMSWLCSGVPDGADIWDYISIATDDESYKDICDCFKRQVARNGWEF